MIQDNVHLLQVIARWPMVTQAQILRILEDAGCPLKASYISRRMARLEQKGWISWSFFHPDHRPPTRSYRITPRGISYLHTHGDLDNPIARLPAEMGPSPTSPLAPSSSRGPASSPSLVSSATTPVTAADMMAYQEDLADLLLDLLNTSSPTDLQRQQIHHFLHQNVRALQRYFGITPIPLSEGSSSEVESPGQASQSAS